MMLQIGVGFAPQTLRALQSQPAQGLMLVVMSDDAPQQVMASSMMIEVAAPSPHEGSYPLSLLDLVRGPVCLVPPVIRQADGVMTVEPGLWAFDGARGAATVTRQWMSEGKVLNTATDATLVPVPGLEPQDIVLAETVRQNGIETSVMSLPVTVPAMELPEPARLSVARNATLGLVVEGKATAKVEVIEPAAYAGQYDIDPARLQDGPLWLAPALIGGSESVGGELSVQHRGLAIGDSEAGPVAVAGQWQRGGNPIPGATGNAYRVQAADAGHRIGYLETATDSRGTRRQLSNEIAIGGTS